MNLQIQNFYDSTVFVSICSFLCIRLGSIARSEAEDTSKPEQDPITTFRKSCSEGDLHTVSHLMDISSDGTDLNVPGSDGTTPFWHACANGHIGIVRAMVDKYAETLNLNEASESGATPFWAACAAGHTEVVRFLVSIHEKLNAPVSTVLFAATYHGQTAVCAACTHGKTDVVRVLLDTLPIESIDGTPDRLLRIPFFMACKHGHTDIVRLFIERLAGKINVQSLSEFTPFAAACDGGHLETVKLMIDVFAKTTDSMASVDAHKPFYMSCLKGRLEVIRLLIEKFTIDVNHASDMTTPLMAASKNGHDKVVEFLFKTFPDLDPNREDRDGRTAAFLATYYCRIAVVKVLLQHKEVDWGHVDRMGRTAWSIASELSLVRERDEILKLLVARKDTQHEAHNKFIGIECAEVPERTCCVIGDCQTNTVCKHCGKVCACAECIEQCHRCPLCRTGTEFLEFKTSFDQGTKVKIVPNASILNMYRGSNEVRDELKPYQDQEGVILQRLTERQYEVSTQFPIFQNKKFEHARILILFHYAR